MIRTTRGVLLRDFLIFQLKLVIDGLKGVFIAQLAIGAVVLDLLSGGGRKRRLFYGVLRVAERFDLWLNLNGSIRRMEAEDDQDGLFGASKAGSDTLLGQIESLVRGGDVPRSARRRAA
jgi:hypothetical protein